MVILIFLESYDVFQPSFFIGKTYMFSARGVPCSDEDHSAFASGRPETTT